MTPHVPDPRTLRKLAGEATPGPWVEQHDDPVERTGFYVDSHANEDGPEPVVPPIHSSYSASFADAAYIAATSPDVVLALLDRLDALEEALKSIAFYDGRLDAAEAARSWRTASAALSADHKIVRRRPTLNTNVVIDEGDEAP